MGPILIVDDEFGIAEALEDLLTDEGYRTLSAQNGRQALERMAEDLPVLVLVDYMMPVMNGPALIEAMQNDERLRSIPVVIMSASPSSSWRDVKAAGYMSKPFKILELLSLLEKLIGRARPD